MEALNFLRFWRPTYSSTQEDHQNLTLSGSMAEGLDPVMEPDNESEDGEESFIDLELPLHDFDDKENACSNNNNNIKNSSNPEENSINDIRRFDFKEEKRNVSTKNGGDAEPSFQQQVLSLPSSDHFSKRKVIPIEPPSKPQSPIALLKSAPKFRVLSFSKSKSMATTLKTERERMAEKTGSISVSMETPKHETQSKRQHSVKFKGEESKNFPVFGRRNSMRRSDGVFEKQRAEDSSADDSSKRFSKDVMSKYLNLIKPLYAKVSKKHSDKTLFSGDLSMSSPMSSPATVYSQREKLGNLPAGIREVCRHLGKSRSASASSSPVSRRDDSLLLQHDGIQSAILHCKRSFNSSRESSLLSRCTSDSSQEKLSDASSADSSALSRVASNSSAEKLMFPARISSEKEKENRFST